MQSEIDPPVGGIGDHRDTIICSAMTSGSSQPAANGMDDRDYLQFSQLAALSQPHQQHGCHSCGRRFDSARRLEKHRLRVHSDRRFPCQSCEKRFKNMKGLVGHELTHVGIERFMCKTCGFAAQSGRSLKLHATTHTRQKTYECSTCRKIFLSSKSRNHHRRRHGVIPTLVPDVPLVEPEDWSFVWEKLAGSTSYASVCESDSQSRLEKEPQDTAAAEEEEAGKSFVCMAEKCDKNFDDAAPHTRHDRNCGRYFAFFSNLQAHQREDHQASSALPYCEYSN